MSPSKQTHQREFLILFLIVATELIGFGLIIPILPQIAEQFETNKIMLGILLSAFSFTQFFASPILGQLSDQYGRKPVLLISKLGTVLSYIIFAFSFNYTGLLIARLLDGFTGGNISVARAYIVDITDKKDRAKGMAIIGISFGFGFIIGPALGGILFGLFNTHTIPALIAGSFSLLAFILTALLLKEPQQHKQMNAKRKKFRHAFTALKDPHIFNICVIQFIYMCIFAGYETTFSVFTHSHYNYTIQENSLLFLYIGIISLVFQGYITQKQMKNLKAAIIIGIGLMGGSFILLSQLYTQWIMFGILIIFSLGICLTMTHLPALLSMYSKDGKSGETMGVYDSLGSLSRIIGPLLAYISFYQDIPLGYTLFGVTLFGLIIFITKKIPPNIH